MFKNKKKHITETVSKSIKNSCHNSKLQIQQCRKKNKHDRKLTCILRYPNQTSKSKKENILARSMKGHFQNGKINEIDNKLQIKTGKQT